MALRPLVSGFRDSGPIAWAPDAGQGAVQTALGWWWAAAARARLGTWPSPLCPDRHDLAANACGMTSPRPHGFR